MRTRWDSKAQFIQDAVVYDKGKGIGTMEVINQCDVAFVYIQTPKKKDGSCDTSIVE
jgi:UDP-glucose 6-dehydrogenase